MTRKQTSGVTLLELMISLAIMGMIALLLANALNFNRQSLERSYLLTQRTQMMLAQSSLRHWVEDMPIDYSGHNATYLFLGEQNQVRFKSRISDGTFKATKNTNITLRLTPNGQFSTLQVVAIGEHPSSPENLTMTRTLATNVSDFKISYFGNLSSEPEKRWHDIWADEIYLPDLIKVEWETHNGIANPPLTLQPAKLARQSVMSISSLIPPG